MNRAQFLGQLRKLLGHRAGYRVDVEAPDAAAREAARPSLLHALKVRVETREQLHQRQRALLEGDAEYQRLLAQARACEKSIESAHGITERYRVTAGVAQGQFFSISAQGDSFADVIDKLKNR